MKAAAQIFALIGSAYALLAAPDLTWLDAGELAAASWELGIAHPPGFAIFAMIHKSVSLSIPLGDIAFRSNLASGLIAGLALATWFTALRLWGIQRWSATIGIVGSACATGFALHASTVEVYSGIGLFAGLMLLGLVHYRQSKDVRVQFALALIMGLSIAGHHPELRLLAVLVMGFLVINTGLNLRRLVAMGVSVIGGLAVIAYLPIRASLAPWRNWGDPSSLDALWSHFWGSRIRAAYANEMGVNIGEAMDTLANQAIESAPFLVLFGLIGTAMAFRFRGGWLLAATLVTEILYSTIINPMGLRDWQNGFLMWCVLGTGAAVLIHEISTRRSRWAWAIGAGLLIASLTSFPINQSWSDDALRTMGNHGFDPMPPETLCLVSSDNTAASFIYRQVVEGSRPDVGLVVRQHVQYASSVNRTHHRHPRMLAGWAAGQTLDALGTLKDRDWPLAWEWTSGLDAEHRPGELRPSFPFFVRGYASHTDFANGVQQATHQLKPGEQPNPARSHMANLSSDLGRFNLVAGEHRKAIDAFRSAVEIEPLAAKRWDNLGAALSTVGQFDSAIQATGHALSLEPGLTTARINRARYLIAVSDWSGAIDTLNGVLADAENPEAYALRGVARGNLGELDAAERDFDSALLLDSEQPEAKSGKDLILRSKRNKAGQ